MAGRSEGRAKGEGGGRRGKEGERLNMAGWLNINSDIIGERDLTI